MRSLADRGRDGEGTAGAGAAGVVGALVMEHKLDCPSASLEKLRHVMEAVLYSDATWLP